MSMTTMIATYQEAKRERDELETQIRTLRSNRAQLQQRLTETEATLAAGQQGRVDELLQGKENAKSVNKAVGLTLFAQDARQALAASEQSETEFYLPLCDAQSRLELAASHLSGHYLSHLEGRSLMLVEKELDGALLPLANLIKAKCVVQDAPQVKQWALGVLSKALDRSLAQATGECDGSDPEVRTILSQGQRSSFPEVIKLGATPGGRMTLRQAQPLPL
ncbi:TPA: hypothetical protein ACQJJO_002079 [Aeromonas veronii]